MLVKNRGGASTSQKASLDFPGGLQNSREPIDHQSETELISLELRSVLDTVREIIGKLVNEEILDTVFAQFRIDK
jgi:tRNA modification GTPase